MPIAWIALSVAFLDFLSKLLLANTDVGGSFVLLDVAVDILHRESAGLPAYLRGVTNITGWVLAAGLVALFSVLFRGRGLFGVAGPAGIGLELAAGGVLSQMVDLFLYAQLVPVVSVRISQAAHLDGGVGQLAILVGGGVFLWEFVQQRRAHPAVALRAADEGSIDLTVLPRGIDNVHIDVILSPGLIKTTQALVHDLVPRYIKQVKLGSRKVNLPKHYFDRLQRAYSTTVESAIAKAKQAGELALLELVQVALLKFIHLEVQRQTQLAVQRFSETLQDHQKRGGGGADGNSHVEWLFRNRHLLAYRVTETLGLALLQCETTTLGKLRRSLFGSHRVIASEALTVPLVYAGSPVNDAVQVQHYVLLGHLDREPNSFPALDALLRSVFQEFMPTAGQDARGAALGLELEGASSEYLRALSHHSVLTSEENATILLDAEWTRRRLVDAKEKGQKEKVAKLKRHLAFQRRMLMQVTASLRHAGLLPYLFASHEVGRLFQHRQWDLDPQLLHKTLRTSGTGPEVKQKLQALLRGPNRPPLEEVYGAWERVQRPQAGEIGPQVVAFMRKFARFRRDLVRYHSTQQAINQVVLLEEEKDIRTSRANFTLHEFLAPDEVDSTTRAIKGHVILKADLRGSTQITDRLVELDLNPAAHFSRHFFEPINEVIERYGAEKVFIEGDAVILILNEYVGDHQPPLIVARGCGLAAGIIQVVETQNRQLAGHGLPQLELGIGIAYTNAPPRFLFDRDTRITISPAINRADRLSACAWAIREWLKGQEATLPGNVAVYEPSAEAAARQEKAQKELVYNLNGVLLEPSAFEKLGKEVKLRPLRKALPEFGDSTLLASRFPDTTGAFHTLVLREAPVRIYDASYRVDSCPVAGDRQFHEVIHDKHIVQRIRESLAKATTSA